MIALAALSGPLPKLGMIAVAALAAAVILARESRAQAWAMAGGLVLSPFLLLADIWHSPQLGLVHRHPLAAVLGAGVALVALAVVAYAIWRRPWLLGPLAVLALPFRVPISVAGNTSNLLVPLYIVVAAGALAWIARALLGDRVGGGNRVGDRVGRGNRVGDRVGGGDRAGARPEVAGAGGSASTTTLPAGVIWLGRLLAAWLLLYALQALYSSDFQKALQQMLFFYLPFALLLVLLRDLHWDRRLLTVCLVITAALAVVFAAIGFVEYETKTLLLNPRLIAANNVHTYFTVNSVFFDPDIFGRYLALVMTLLTAVLLYDDRVRTQLAVSVVLAILWVGLVLTLSRSSLAALLVGLGALAAMRWRAWPVLAAAAVVVVAGTGALALSPRTFGLNQGLNNASSGRASLVTGGVRMFEARPLYGYGSASFVVEYRTREHPVNPVLAASHTIPVTIAAEQGVIGLILYLPLMLVAALTLLSGARSSGERAAIAAAFLALALHTMLYADFLEDPVTWTLLGVGSALAVAQRRPEQPSVTARERWLKRRAAREAHAPAGAGV